MKLILKDGTEFECLSLYQNHTINHGEKDYYQDGCFIKFALSEHPQELYQALRKSFVDENVTEITTVSTYGEVDVQVSHSFSKVVSVSMTLQDNTGVIDIYLV